MADANLIHDATGAFRSMPQDLTRLSRVVSHALRHEPWLYELELDGEGWTNVDALLVALRQEFPGWADLSEQDLADMIRVSSKQRHEMANGRIRALYGHSLPEKLSKRAATPPAILFHGTAPATVSIIQREGLKPMRRQFVHLSTNREDAIAVGKRKAQEPIILAVRSGEASAAGVVFYEGNERVWLADHVPPEHIELQAK
jgi:putative RNA 2'-phosphotransferase